VAEDAILEHARQVNLDLASHMPNFIAHEVVTHYFDRKGEWEHDYTVEDEIAVKGNQISRRDFRRSGKPRSVMGFMGRTGIGLPPTGFGAALQPLFDSRCPTTLELAGDDELSGKAVLAYRFHSPANGCFGNLYFPWGSTYNAARRGRALIDGPSGSVVQFEEEAYGFPERYRLIARHQVMTWNYVKIGDASYWLPVSAEFIWTFKRLRAREVVEYRNHRHFESTTDIKYR